MVRTGQVELRRVEKLRRLGPQQRRLAAEAERSYRQALTLRQQGQPRQAVEALRQALERYEAMLGDRQIESAMALHALAET
jgi:hypothetical protein